MISITSRPYFTVTLRWTENAADVYSFPLFSAWTQSAGKASGEISPACPDQLPLPSVNSVDQALSQPSGSVSVAIIIMFILWLSRELQIKQRSGTSVHGHIMELYRIIMLHQDQDVLIQEAGLSIIISIIIVTYYSRIRKMV